MSETWATMPGRVVDAHMHLWDLSLARHPWLCGAPIAFRYGDYSAIRRSYGPADYRRDAGVVPVIGTVYVETEWERTDPVGETHWISGLAAREGFPNAVVAQAFLDAEDVAETLAAQASFPLVRGVRHKPASTRREAARRGAPGSMDDPRWRDGFARLEAHRLSFDLQTPWWHLDAAADLARDFPATVIVLNHTGLPADRSPEALVAWRIALERFAAEPNSRIKISGIGEPGVAWTVARNRAIVRTAIDVFGANRAMFASNFPVDSLTASFGEIYRGFSRITADLDAEHRAALFGGTATEVYRIAVDQPEATGPLVKEETS